MQIDRFTKLIGFMLFLTMFAVVACEGSEAENNPADDDDDNNDDDNNNDNNDDDNQDSESESEEIIDTDNSDLCATYPKSDDNFAKDSVITNYELIDEKGNSSRICQLAENQKYILMKISADMCAECQKQLPHLERFTTEYADRGVVVMEAQQGAMTDGELADWKADYDYKTFRTTPKSQQIMEDYRKTELFNAKGVYLLIDAVTMKVLNSFCSENAEEAEENCLKDL